MIQKRKMPEKTHSLAKTLSFYVLTYVKETVNFPTVAPHTPYWQAKEISWVIQECDPSDAQVDLSLLKHISPIGWENVILYGEYVLNRSLIQP